MESFFNWLLFLITFLIGYFLGRGKLNKEGLKEAKEAMIEVLKESRVGAIKRPTARDIYLREHPQVKEGMEAMKEDLDKLKI